MRNANYLFDGGTVGFYLVALYAFFTCISLAGLNISLSLAFLWGIATWKRQQNYKINMDRTLLQALLAFLGAMVISALFAPEIKVAFQQIGSHIYRFLPFVLAVFFVRTKRQLGIILIILGISIVIADLYAIKQSIGEGRRVTAFMSNAMLYAGQLILLLPIFATALLVGDNVGKKEKKFFAIVIVLSITGLILNVTRGAWLAVFFAVCIPLFIIARRNTHMWMILFSSFAICFLLTFHNPYIEQRIQSTNDLSQRSSSERLLVWSSAWQMFLDNPIIGVGTNNFEKVYTEKYILHEAKMRLTHAHSNFLQVLAENGVIGFCTFIFLFGYIICSRARQYLRDPKSNYWDLALVLATLSFMIHGMTEYNFDDPPVTRLYWFLLGLSYVSSQVNLCRASENDLEHERSQ